MQIGLDACVIDWLLESPRAPEFLEVVRQGKVTVWLSGDVVTEVHRAQDLPKRHRLLMLLFTNFRKFLPTEAYVIERDRGNRRKLTGILGTPRAMALQRTLSAIGVKKSEAVHIVDAYLGGCSVFVTLDRRDILRRRHAIKQRIQIDVVDRDELLDSVVQPN